MEINKYMFKETKEGATNYCVKCELEGRQIKSPYPKEMQFEELTHTCGKESNMKEKIKEIIQKNIIYDSVDTEKAADQILDLILSKIVIEKEKSFGVGHSYRMDGWNECIDQLEEIKNKLRE